MQIANRLKALEAHRARQHEKAVRVIRGADETDEQAIQREGVEPSGELLNDLIRDKAKLMGISAQEMKSKLGSVDANLLSALLATPIGAAIYAKYQNGLESD